MNTFYIRFRGTEITTVFRDLQHGTYTTHCDENLLFFYFNYEVESHNDEDMTCVLKKKEIIDEQINN
jgi:hypothetical protein